MKNLFAAVIFTIILAGVSFGQSGATLQVEGDKRIALITFTGEADATPSGTQALQNGVATAMAKREGHKDWIEIPSTSVQVRGLYKQLLGRPVDTATAVKIGKLLGVNYVVTGHVKVFSGVCNVRLQIVDVAAEKIGWTGEASHTGITKTGAGTLVINAATVNSITQKLNPDQAMAELLRKTLEKG